MSTVRSRIGLSIALAAALTAGACGGKSKTDSATDSTSGDPTAGVTDITTAAGDPVDGGKIIYGLEAETSGFNPVADRWAISAYQVASAVYDPLFAFDDEGNWQPYLAESMVPNEDNTVWVLTLRSDVVFHDGTTLNAEDVAYMYNKHRESPLTKPVLADVESVEATGPLEVTFTMSRGWATFPLSLMTQVGVVPARSVLDDPQGGLNPVGTGPFKMKRYEPDSAFVAVKFDDYWQEGLPHLDEIEFKPIVELTSRQSALRAGDIHIFSTTNRAVIDESQEECAAGECQLVLDDGESDEGLVMLNTAVPPFNQLIARQAAAAAIDREGYIETLQPGATMANGPFAPNSPWYDEDAANTYPGYDPELAKKLVAQYEEEFGPFEFDLGATTDPLTLEQAEFVEANFKEAGMDVSITRTEQASFVLDAVTGKFQANLWRQFGETDPDAAYVWWVSANATEPPGLGLNIARNKDPIIDDAMQAARETDDIEARKASYATVVERLNTDLPYLWTFHTQWAFIASTKLHGLTNGPLPNGEPSMPIQAGVARVGYLWLEP